MAISEIFLSDKPEQLIASAIIVLLMLTGSCSRKPKSIAPAKTKKASKSKKENEIAKSENPKQLLRDVHYWAYQIQNQAKKGNIKKLVKAHYDLLVIDQTRSLKEQQDYNSKADVSLLKNSGGSSKPKKRKLVVCYLDVGEAESYRWYWQKGWKIGSPSWIVAADPDGWDKNYPVKIWDSEWKRIMRKSIDRIIEDGYDGIYLDWLEVYSFEPVANAAKAAGLDPRIELTKFVAELSEYARSKKPDFLFIAQNGAELETFPEYTNLFDAIAQEAIWYDASGDPDAAETHGDEPVDMDESDELIDLLKKWQQQGKVVLDVEYAQEPSNVKEAYKLGQENGFKTYVTLRSLDKLTSMLPPGY